MTGSLPGANDEPIRVRLDASEADVAQPGSLAEQIPHANSLPPGTRVLVLATATRQGGVLRRLLGRGSVAVPRSTRATALLVRGYVDIVERSDETEGTVPTS